MNFPARQTTRTNEFSIGYRSDGTEGGRHQMAGLTFHESAGAAEQVLENHIHPRIDLYHGIVPPQGRYAEEISSACDASSEST
jgi:hypothetical protein